MIVVILFPTYSVSSENFCCSKELPGGSFKLFRQLLDILVHRWMKYCFRQGKEIFMRKQWVVCIHLLPKKVLLLRCKKWPQFEKWKALQNLPYKVCKRLFFVLFPRKLLSFALKQIEVWYLKKICGMNFAKKLTMLMQCPFDIVKSRKFF